MLGNRAGDDLRKHYSKRLPIKGVLRGEMPLDRFCAVMVEQARSEEALRLAVRTQWTQRGLWDPTP